MKRIVALALAASLSSAAFAASETYVLDTNHTKPRFEYSHFGYSTQLSRFDTVKGTVTIDRAAKTGSVNVEIDAKSVDTGYPLFNEHIQGEDFFDTAKYPDDHLQVGQTQVRWRQGGCGGRQFDDQGNHQTGDAHRDLLHVHAAPDNEKGCLRCQRNCSGKTL